MHGPVSESAKSRREGGRSGCASVVGGLVLVAIGIPLLVLPGPGVVVLMAGAGLIASGLGLRRPRGR